MAKVAFISEIMRSQKMKRIIVREHLNLSWDNVNKYFIVFRKIIRANISVLLDFSKIDKGNKIPASFKMLISACDEKRKKGDKGQIFGVGIRNREDHYVRAMHLTQNKEQIELKMLAGDHFSTIHPRAVSVVVRELRKIGINKNNPSYSEQHERVEALLTEILANAIEHGIERQNINCWITTDVDNKNKKICFTFVDLGIGIAGSHRKAGLGFLHKFLPDWAIVKKSLNGNLKSSTGKLNRGKGLPEIAEVVKSGFVEDFMLVTNKVAIRFNNAKEIETRSVPSFEGTYYRWIVKK